LSLQYIAKPVGKGILTFFFLLICLSFLPSEGGKNNEHQIREISHALTQTPLSGVARIANHSPAEAMDILQLRGISIESEAQTIQNIAVKNKKNPTEILDVIF